MEEHHCRDTSVFELKRDGSDGYSYSSVNEARGIFKLAYSDAITQASRFRIIDGRVGSELIQRLG